MLLRTFTRLLLSGGALDGEHFFVAVGLDLVRFNVDGPDFGGHRGVVVTCYSMSPKGCDVFQIEREGRQTLKVRQLASLVLWLPS